MTVYKKANLYTFVILHSHHLLVMQTLNSTIILFTKVPNKKDERQTI